MSHHAFLIDYEWCTGCHSCELACQMHNDLPTGQFGIKLTEVGPWPYGERQWQYAFVPVVTDQCTLCAARTEKGKAPSCVQHCQSQCLVFGELDELMGRLDEKPKVILQVID